MVGHYLGAEFGGTSDPGQDPRGALDQEPLWNFLDLRRPAEGTGVRRLTIWPTRNAQGHTPLAKLKGAMKSDLITTKPLTAGSRIAAKISLASTAVFLILLAALHFIEPQIDPSWHMISEYEIGRFGW